MDHIIKNSQPSASKHGDYMKPRRRNGFTSIVMFFVIIISVIFVMSVFLRVSVIEVNGNEHYTDDEIIRAIDIEEGDNIFFFDRFAAISRVFAKLPYVEEVSVERTLPNKVTVSVVECKAMAYIVLGDESWTIDHSCKVLGKAAGNETDELIPIVGFNPGTLLIGETLTTNDGDTSPVEYLSEILTQIQGRGMTNDVRKIDFTNIRKVQFSYKGIFTVILGQNRSVEHKFAMLESAMLQLKDGDVGIIDLSDATTIKFTPR